ncbi:hypothetical protein AB0O57_02345 [Streptomyces sp. NPDC091201]|uniref:hypothetical protein n=1 Tax=Streptomyces sp. NPDC091201 TaxID=3155190 RepID=UPI00343D4CCC
MPTWEFVEDLLRDLAEVQQVPVKPEVFGHIRDQHRQALRVSNTGLYELQVLADQLEQADREQRQAAVREQALLEALQARQRRIAELETDRRRLEIDWSAERTERERISEIHLNRTQAYTEELDQLRREIEDLRIKLLEAESLNEAAEMRCQALEEQIEELESKYSGGFSQVAPEGAARNADEQASPITHKSPQKWQALVFRKSPTEIVSEVVRSETLGAGPPQQLYEAIATGGDVQTVKEILSRLEEVGQTTAAYRLLRTVLRMSAVSDVYALLGFTEAGFLKVGGHSEGTLLLWFTYDSSPSRIIELLRLLRNEKRKEWSTFLLQCVGRSDYGDAVKLRDVVARVDASDTHTLLSSTAQRLETDNFPRLLHVLREAAMNEQADWLISKFTEVRSADVAVLKSALQVLGAAEEIRILERAVEE